MKKINEDADTGSVFGVVWLISMACTSYMIGALIFAHDEISNRSVFFGFFSVAIFFDLLTSFLLYFYLTKEEMKETLDIKIDEVREKNNDRT